jgi:hypothetical protein
MVFRGSELRWMAMGLMTLVVLFLLISRLREQGAAARVAEAETTAPDQHASPPAMPLPSPTGLTDEDPDEAELAQEELRGLSDGTVGLGHEEMIPYNRLVSWVKNQSFARLWARGEKNLAYTYLYDDAPRQRGKLVAMDVEIRLVRNLGKNEAGVPLYEASAVTQQSGNHLYELVIVDFPTTMPVDTFIRERAKFAGYFFKLQGFEAGNAQPGRPPEKAPLLIGRIEWNPGAAASQDAGGEEWIWAVAALAVVALALLVVFRRRSRGPTLLHPSILPPPSGGVIPVDVWLEQCGSQPHGEGDRKGSEE